MAKVNGSIVRPVNTQKTKERVCERCGLHTSRHAGRNRNDGLVLCTDCKSDKWLIKKFSAR